MVSKVPRGVGRWMARADIREREGHCPQLKTDWFLAKLSAASTTNINKIVPSQKESSLEPISSSLSAFFSSLQKQLVSGRVFLQPFVT